ncbi:hypothetical protein ACP70R_029186 [Stipagrostis hirtigluma subsp. patula]
MGSASLVPSARPSPTEYAKAQDPHGLPSARRRDPRADVAVREARRALPLSGSRMLPPPARQRASGLRVRFALPHRAPRRPLSSVAAEAQML